MSSVSHDGLVKAHPTLTPEEAEKWCRVNCRINEVFATAGSPALTNRSRGTPASVPSALREREREGVRRRRQCLLVEPTELLDAASVKLVAPVHNTVVEANTCAAVNSNRPKTKLEG
ncbi:hypothetical protein LSM04_008980 [Trypanosoma melophagium]|uniref:uncharacterized protein n=1 Tax=Trypanosoma melophagium TaxID=715481 RepID=UPI00351A98F7|nr:hypothetical protein LSM04_008980 [Trypanosoma melophagium]